MAKAKTKAAPKGYHTITTYLTVEGARDVLDFITNAFDAKVEEKHMNDDGSVMHAEATIGDTRIMVGEAAGIAPMPAMFYMYVPDCDKAYEKALQAGADPVMPPTDRFYGDRSGGVQDNAGNVWWIATRKESPSKPIPQKRGARVKKK